VNTTYFYVNTTNSYLYHHIEFNDNDTEYIQANFNIPNFSDDNYSITHYGYEYGNGYGYFGVVYDDSSTLFFQISGGETSYYLNYEKSIDDIAIIYTDSDEYYNGENNGWIAYIEFVYLPNIDIDIGTLSLTNAIIDIIVIIIPSLLIYYSFDKKKEVLLISMLLMSIVCFATNLISVQLFFLHVVCYGMFFFLRTKEGAF